MLNQLLVHHVKTVTAEETEITVIVIAEEVLEDNLEIIILKTLKSPQKGGFFYDTSIEL